MASSISRNVSQMNPVPQSSIISGTDPAQRAISGVSEASRSGGSRRSSQGQLKGWFGGSPHEYGTALPNHLVDSLANFGVTEDVAQVLQYPLGLFIRKLTDQAAQFHFRRHATTTLPNLVQPTRWGHFSTDTTRSGG
jgi:hypothetical protein